jgi:amino acid transporter
VCSSDLTILVFLFVVGGWAIIKKTLPSYLRTHNRLFLWVYSLLAWIVLAMTTANMGIALRQKWMFLPMIIFLILSQVGFKKETSVQKKAEDWNV